MLNRRDERPCPGDMGLDAARWNATRLGLWEPTWSELRRDPMLFGAAVLGLRAGKTHQLRLVAEWARKQGLDVRVLSPDAAIRGGHRIGKRSMGERVLDECVRTSPDRA